MKKTAKSLNGDHPTLNTTLPVSRADTVLSLLGGELRCSWQWK